MLENYLFFIHDVQVETRTFISAAAACKRAEQISHWRALNGVDFSVQVYEDRGEYEYPNWIATYQAGSCVSHA